MMRADKFVAGDWQRGWEKRERRNGESPAGGRANISEREESVTTRSGSAWRGMVNDLSEKGRKAVADNQGKRSAGNQSLKQPQDLSILIGGEISSLTLV